MARATHESGLAGITERNIAALLKRRSLEEKKKSPQVKLADGITKFTGSMKFVYIHLVLFGGWIVFNLPWFPGLPKFDPTFVILAMFASVEAIFLSTFILISQNRMAEMEDRRADLDLQTGLLAEHEITRMLTLVRAMAKKMDIREARDPELSELEHDVAPEAVLDKIEEAGEGFSEDEGHGRD